MVQYLLIQFFFFFQAEDGIRDYKVTGVQTCALPISRQASPVGLTVANSATASWAYSLKPASEKRLERAVPTMRYRSGSRPAAARWNNPGSNFRLARSPVAPKSTITWGSGRPGRWVVGRDGLSELITPHFGCSVIGADPDRGRATVMVVPRAGAPASDSLAPRRSPRHHGQYPSSRRASRGGRPPASR